MELSRDSRIIKWAYFAWDDDFRCSYIPSRTSLCAVFWRSILFTPIKLLIPLIGLSIYVGLWKDFTPQVFAVHLLVAFILGLALLAARISDARRQRRYRKYQENLANPMTNYRAPKPPGWGYVLVEGFWAIKNRVCPIITIRRD